MIDDATSCYRALSARDARFDGVFFVAVTTTGIYCRPVCRARLPAPDRCRYFGSAAAAEAAGYRPCLRCHPERAPGRSSVDARVRIADLAMKGIAEGSLNRGGVAGLAAELHIGARQLRRAIRHTYGVTPIQLAQTHRLLLAKQLLTETDLRLIDIAYASGFSSVRRFNALFRERYGMKPSDLRRRRPHGAAATLTLTLDTRPPYDWTAMLEFLAARAIPGVEAVESGRYSRTVALAGARGWFAVEPSRHAPGIRVSVSHSLLPVLIPLLARIRHLFDLDAEPSIINAHLQSHPLLQAEIARAPGVRVPGAADGFELACRAILGQQVSVRAARTLATRIAHTFGEPADFEHPQLRYFPIAAGTVASAGAARLTELGVTRGRAECIRAIAHAAAEGRLRLDPGADAPETMARLEEFPGVGAWTAQYVAMRALHWPDAFPLGDLALQRASGETSPGRLRRAAEAWRPWRAYAAMHLWRSQASAAGVRHTAGVRPDRAVIEPYDRRGSA